MNDIKNEILKAKTMDDIMNIEDKAYKEFRNNLYNEILKDKKIKKHISEISNVDIDELENLLMINDNTPLDYFNED